LGKNGGLLALACKRPPNKSDVAPLAHSLPLSALSLVTLCREQRLKACLSNPSKGSRMTFRSYKTVIEIFLLMVLLSSVPILTSAQTPDDLSQKSLEDLMNIEVKSVYSASKYSQKVTEAPSSVSIVTAEQIQRYGYRTLAEILGSVRGFYLTYDRNYSYVGVRGFARPGDYNTRILLLVDGHRINDNVYDQAFLGREFPIDVDLIERVEIVRGPSSSLYGTSAFFAVINVITKRGRTVKGFEVSTEVASFQSYKTRLSYGKKISDNSEMLLSGSYFSSKGPQHLYFKEFDTPATNNGIAENADDEKAGSMFGDVAFHDFSVRGSYGAREKGIPTAAFATVFNDRRTRTKDRRGYVDVGYDHTFTNQLGLVARASYDSYKYDGVYIFDFSEEGGSENTINIDNSRGRWWSAELQLTKTLRHHRLTAGTEYRDNITQSQFNGYDNDPVPLVDDHRTSKNFALFVQDEVSIGENVTLSAGGRYDHHSTFGGNLEPRVALIYHPGAKSTVKLLYGEAFRAPNAYELYYYDTSADAGSKIKPETIRTGELVFEHYLGDHFRISASGYIYRLKGLITQQFDPTTTEEISFKNLEQIASRGFEFEIEGKLPAGFEGNVAYTLQRSFERETGQALTNSPRHLGKLNLISPLLKRRVFAGLQFQYSSARKTLDGTTLPSTYLTNLTVFGKKIAKGLDVSFGAYNVFNQKYFDPGSEEHRMNAIEQNGRNFALKLTYHF
jgi:iron complex outermembrane receptor protein